MIEGIIGCGLADGIIDTETRLAEHIKTVESHLSVVIQMFERHLREDRGHCPS